MKKDVFIMKMMLFVLVFVFTGINVSRTYGYTDESLYREKLEFDSEGNLVMMTHDKRATSSILYRTIGWVIKRYDMPMNANGQQYAIIPLRGDIQYVDDPNNSQYLYCVYYGDKQTISDAIGRVSKEWKNQLYNYGDEVYIDEIMTVVENGSICGGLTGITGNYWGEVYFNYDGISNARKWASKTSLLTHFDKKVYFPPQLSRKYFKKTVMTTGEIVNEREPDNHLEIHEGNSYVSTYDVNQGVPTGSCLYVKGKVSPLIYKVIFEKKTVSYSIPIEFVIDYTLKWKAYDGSIKTENKRISQWYYVNRTVSYYDLKNFTLKTLNKIFVNNYAFEDGGIEKNQNISVRVKKTDYKEDTDHVKFSDYSETYYINGGTITQYNVPGVKPAIPEVNRQSMANKKIGNIYVRNDALNFASTSVSTATWFSENAPEPYMGIIGDEKKDIYLAGNLIPHTKENYMNCKSRGSAEYKDYESGNINNYQIKNINSVSIHTPICISGEVIEKENGFSIKPVTYGEHRDYMGYGTRDYKGFVKEIKVRFDKDVIRTYSNGNEEVVAKDTFIKLNSEDIFRYSDEEREGEHVVEIRAYSKNIPGYALYTEEEYMQESANTEIRKYIVNNNITFTLTGKIEQDKISYDVVGTH